MKKKTDETPAFVQEPVVSATECTGLIPSGIQDDQQAEALCDLYDIPKCKPQTYHEEEHTQKKENDGQSC